MAVSEEEQGIEFGGIEDDGLHEEKRSLPLEVFFHLEFVNGEFEVERAEVVEVNEGLCLEGFGEVIDLDGEEVLFQLDFEGDYLLRLNPGVIGDFVLVLLLWNDDVFLEELLLEKVDGGVDVGQSGSFGVLERFVQRGKGLVVGLKNV